MEKLSNVKRKWIRSLHHKKYREKYGYFIGEGDKLFKELSKKQLNNLHALIATEEWWDSNPGLADNLEDCEAYTVISRDMGQISTNKTPQSPLMVFESPGESNFTGDTEQSMILYLDGIRDPGNLGTIIRLADWFGHEQIFLSPDCVDWKNPKVIQSSMGSFLRINIVYADLADLKTDSVGKRRFIAADMKGSLLEDCDLDHSLLIIGNESQGVRRDCQPFIDEYVHIPGKGTAESLNAAIAASIICYQAYIN